MCCFNSRIHTGHLSLFLVRAAAHLVASLCAAIIIVAIRIYACFNKF